MKQEQSALNELNDVSKGTRAAILGFHLDLMLVEFPPHGGVCYVGKVFHPQGTADWCDC